VKDSPHFLLRCPKYAAILAYFGGHFGVGFCGDTAAFSWSGSGCGGSWCCVYVEIEDASIADMMATGDWCMCLCSEDEGGIEFSQMWKCLLILDTV